MPVFSEIRDLGQHVGDTITVRGWVQTIRTHGKVAFAVVRDGTGVVQGVIVQKQSTPELWERVTTLSIETSVHLTGAVGAVAPAPGGYEV